MTMVHEVEEDPDVFVATGYPFDMPPPGSTLWAWTIAQFRWTRPPRVAEVACARRGGEAAQGAARARCHLQGEGGSAEGAR